MNCIGSDDNIDEDCEEDDTSLKNGRYCIIKHLHTGYYGRMYKACDLMNAKSPVVMKRVPLDRRRVVNNAEYLKCIHRQVRLLTHLKHRNVSSLINAFISPSMRAIYLVTEYLDVTLTYVIQVNHLNDSKISYLLYQMLSGLHYLHNSCIIHRNIKPDNVMIDLHNSRVKIIDFSCAIFHSPHSGSFDYDNVNDESYWRAPELLAGDYITGYNCKVDIWSLGCICYQMFTRHILFQCDTLYEHLSSIMSICGPATEGLIDRMSNEIASYIHTFPVDTSIDTLLANYNSHAVGLIEWMLSLDPDARPSAHQCLGHHFIASYTIYSDNNSKSLFDKFEEKAFSSSQWKQLIVHLVETFERQREGSLSK